MRIIDYFSWLIVLFLPFFGLGFVILFLYALITFSNFIFNRMDGYQPKDDDIDWGDPPRGGSGVTKNGNSNTKEN